MSTSETIALATAVLTIVLILGMFFDLLRRAK